MLFELFDLPFDVRTGHLLWGLGVGVVFGALALITRFCIRRAIAGDFSERGSAAGVWMTAFIAALISVQSLIASGWILIDDHRLLSNSLPLFAIVLGGLAFGAGMVLTRGCVSRLTVLSATGNLRAVFVLIVFSIVAHATLKGVLAPVRTGLGSLTIELPVASFGDLFGGSFLWVAVITVIAGFYILRSRARKLDLFLAALLGIVIALGWVGTSVFLADEFDPMPVQSLAFTLPWSETLFWTIASSAIPAGFGVGLVGGVLLGSFLAAALRGELAFQSFTSAPEMGRYVTGGALMGFGGVLAGGCTVGAGLSGTSLLSFAAFIALGSIVIGALITRTFLEPKANLIVVAAE